MRLNAFILAAFLCLIPISVFSHPGGKDSNGCHTNRKTGERHGHPPSSKCGTILPTREEKLRDRPLIYANCDAVRAAGVNPIRRGERGYGRHLDRDGDGIACECGKKGKKSTIGEGENDGCNSVKPNT